MYLTTNPQINGSELRYFRMVSNSCSTNGTLRVKAKGLGTISDMDNSMHKIQITWIRIKTNGIKDERTSFSRGNRSGHYTKNDKNMKIWNWSKWKTRITLKRRGELICLGSSRAVSCKSGKNPQNILFPAKKVIYFQLHTNPVISRFTWPLQKFELS